MRRLLVGFALLLPVVFALDMAQGSEQFFVSQNMFVNLGIVPTPCNLPDDTINLACGNYSADFVTFKANLDAVVAQNFPGLYLAADFFWSGEAAVRDYRSQTGQYLVSYTPGGIIIVAFIPLP